MRGINSPILHGLLFFTFLLLLLQWESAEAASSPKECKKNVSKLAKAQVKSIKAGVKSTKSSLKAADKAIKTSIKQFRNALISSIKASGLSKFAMKYEIRQAKINSTLYIHAQRHKIQKSIAANGRFAQCQVKKIKLLLSCYKENCKTSSDFSADKPNDCSTSISCETLTVIPPGRACPGPVATTQPFVSTDKPIIIEVCQHSSTTVALIVDDSLGFLEFSDGTSRTEVKGTCSCTNGDQAFLFETVPNVNPIAEGVIAVSTSDGTYSVTQFTVCVGDGSCYSTNNTDGQIYNFVLSGFCISGGGTCDFYLMMRCDSGSTVDGLYNVNGNGESLVTCADTYPHFDSTSHSSSPPIDGSQKFYPKVVAVTAGSFDAVQGAQCLGVFTPV